MTATDGDATAAPIDVVCFDLDDTLCAYRRDPGAVLDAAAERAGVSPPFSVADYYDRYDDYLDESDDVRDLRRRCFADLAAEAGADPAVGRALARAYTAKRDQRDVERLAGASEALAALDDYGYRLGLVTNGAPAMQRAKLEAVGLSDTFETVVCAGYDAPAKPDPGPFERALEALDAAPERAVHVGNSLSSDVAGARAAGLRPVWIPDPGRERPATPDPEPAYVLESLSELTAPPWRGRG